MIEVKCVKKWMEGAEKVCPQEGRASIEVLRQTGRKYCKMSRDHSPRETITRDKPTEVGKSQTR